MDNDYHIKQDDKIILSGDETSIKMIFRNMTGANFTDNRDEYAQYKKFIKEQGFDLNRIFKMYHKDTFLEVGHFLRTRS